jgi:hypothetical protein
MPSTSALPYSPGVGNGFSVVFAERTLREAQALHLDQPWAQLPLGHPTRRRTSSTPQQRITALLAGLACGLKGIAPGNTFLRPNTALQAWLGGRFPDQGTIHRWLGQVTGPQAAALRHHLHQVAHDHGRFWEVLASDHPLVVDIDGQGLAAKGPRFEQAAVGYLGEGLDQGYQRYVGYAAETREVLDEFLAPGNKTLMSQRPEVLNGLDEGIPHASRGRVILRLDSHGGTIANVRLMRPHNYHYVCPLLSGAAVQRLRQHLTGQRGGWFEETDRAGPVHRVQFGVLRRWALSGRGRGHKLYSRVTVYHETRPDGQREWLALLSDLKREKGRRLWRRYHERGGTIEEYNDQSERAYHLEVVRTGYFEGLQALHSLIGLCWNLTQWAIETLRLPPLQAPGAAGWRRWRWTWRRSRGARRTAACGWSARPGAVLDVEDTAATAESAAWLRWLQQPIQLRLRLTG